LESVNVNLQFITAISSDILHIKTAKSKERDNVFAATDLLAMCC